jgi:hypothetical protein
LARTYDGQFPHELEVLDLEDGDEALCSSLRIGPRHMQHDGPGCLKAVTDEQLTEVEVFADNDTPFRLRKRHKSDIVGAAVCVRCISSIVAGVAKRVGDGSRAGLINEKRGHYSAAATISRAM